MNLHKTILSSRREGYDGLEENSDFLEGITPEQLSEISESFSQASFLFVPANMVPESETSMRLVSSGQDLSSRYVVYRGFKRGVGHDDTYG
tara:strand:+ start:1720 stop:1992 length:273 start_codon:yes stop_codon:yes gene_type:complete